MPLKRKNFWITIYAEARYTADRVSNHGRVRLRSITFSNRFSEVSVSGK